MCNKLISVIVPVYNTASYLKEALNSIKKQTYDNIEIIVVDDGSSDCSGKICDYFQSLDSRFIVYHIDNHGYSYARNFGINVAKGEFITFVDSDDICDVDLLRTQVMMIEQYDADVSICVARNFYKNKIVKFDEKIKNVVLHSECINQLILSFGDWSGSAYAGGQCWKKMIRKKICEDVKFIEDIGSCEDELFTKQILDVSKKTVLNKNGVYFYRMRKQSAVHDPHFVIKNIKSRLKMLELGYIDEGTFVRSTVGKLIGIFKINPLVLAESELFVIRAFLDKCQGEYNELSRTNKVIIRYFLDKKISLLLKLKIAYVIMRPVFFIYTIFCRKKFFL